MIQDKNVRDLLKDMIATLRDACGILASFAAAQKKEEFFTLARDMLFSMQKIGEAAQPYAAQEPTIRLPDACVCAIDSLKRICDYFPADSGRAEEKIRYELWPILNTCYVQFCFWGCAYPDEAEMESFQNNVVSQFVLNPMLAESFQTGKYPYDVSVIVTGYNKLDYTQLCVESLIRNLPKGLRTEVILLNHGSTDETKAYFESVAKNFEHVKQMDITVNGALPAVVWGCAEGEYLLFVSNDTIITPNAIEVMYQCARDDPACGWVVPTTPNVSNLQTIPMAYETLQELEDCGRANNVRDVRREEHRARLCNPITMARAKTYVAAEYALLRDHWCAKSQYSFPDDMISYWFRSNGYHLTLAKDAFCHHFGSVTLANSSTDKFYAEGRTEFKKRWGFDPWGVGFCYSYELFSYLPCEDNEPVKIAGINSGIGSNPLKVREKIKETTGNMDAEIYNYYDRANGVYARGLKGVSDHVELFKNWNVLLKTLKKEQFDYILMDEGIERTADYLNGMKRLLDCLKTEGRLCVQFQTAELRIKAAEQLCGAQVGDWVILTKPSEN